MPFVQRVIHKREWFQHRPVQRQSTHVAAVCYRIQNGEIEFLLVKSRAGRWTFPKGRVDGDPTRAAAAAREAYEEAGVVGKVEPLPFMSYVHVKGSSFSNSFSECQVDAHLCEVTDLVSPQEPYRDPTWFSAQKSKRRLHEKRETRHGSELARVVEHAVSRIGQRHRIRQRAS